MPLSPVEELQQLLRRLTDAQLEMLLEQYGFGAEICARNGEAFKKKRAQMN